MCSLELGGKHDFIQFYLYYMCNIIHRHVECALLESGGFSPHVYMLPP